jgi:hypothetical protein
MLFQSLNEPGARVPVDEREDHDPPAGGADLFTADDVLGAVVTAFDQDIRDERGDQLAWSVFVEGGHGVHAAEAGQDVESIVEVDDRPGLAFEAADRLVGVDPDDQLVTQVPCSEEVLDVTAVEEIEAPVGEDEASGPWPAEAVH